MNSDNKLILVLAAVFGLLGYMMSSYLFKDGSGLMGDASQIQQIKLLQNESRALAQDKPVLLNVWATWCPPCIQEMPMLSRLHAAGDVHVIAIATDDQDDVQSFIAKRDFAFDVAMMQDNPEVNSAFEVPNTIPYSILLDQKGVIRWVKRGAMSESELKEQLEDLNG